MRAHGPDRLPTIKGKHMPLEALWSDLVNTVSGWPPSVKLALSLLGICVLMRGRHHDDANL
jgi:hypothetical protein